MRYEIPKEWGVVSIPTTHTFSKLNPDCYTNLTRFPRLDRQLGIARPFIPRTEVVPDIFDACFFKRNQRIRRSRAFEAVNVIKMSRLHHLLY